MAIPALPACRAASPSAVVSKTKRRSCLVKSTLFANVARGGVETSGTSGDGFGGGLDESFRDGHRHKQCHHRQPRSGGAGSAETNGGDRDWRWNRRGDRQFSGHHRQFVVNHEWHHRATQRRRGGAGGSGADGGNGSGGGVFVGAGGSAFIQQTLITLNGALGGLAGTGGSDGDGIGGGLYVASGLRSPSSTRK